MSAAASAGRRNRSMFLVVSASAALTIAAFSMPGQAEQASVADEVIWDSKSETTIEELTRHAREIGDLLDGASARVEGLVEEAEGNPEAEALAGAVRQELVLSRQWNRHLTSILLEVAETRRALELREQQAADEIFELTAAAEEARHELMALWKVLQPETKASVSSPERLPALKPDDLVDELAGPGASIEDARETLDRMGDMQVEAAGDIEAVRSKIIDALHTLEPHRHQPSRCRTAEGTGGSRQPVLPRHHRLGGIDFQQVAS